MVLCTNLNRTFFLMGNIPFQKNCRLFVYLHMFCRLSCQVLELQYAVFIVVAFLSFHLKSFSGLKESVYVLLYY